MPPQLSGSDLTGPAGIGLASAVLMVRPAAFGPNPETASTNKFQHAAGPEIESDLLTRARRESDLLAAALRSNGVDVFTLEDVAVPPKPDACFPNNWITFHPDGTVVVYPMLAPNRRVERRIDAVLALVRRNGYRVEHLVDLRSWEERGAYLEGTGSLVLDHTTRLAFAALSPRTCPGPVADFASELGFDPILFQALDARGCPVYHTNVVMSLGEGLAILCADAIPEAGQRDLVRTRIRETCREIVQIDMDQMAAYAGNVLMLRTRSGASIMVMSSTAFRRLRRDQLGVIERHAAVVTADVGTIEWFGGGSVRCMLAEIFLPRS